MRPPPRGLHKAPPFQGRVPNPKTPAVVRAPRSDLGDLVEMFPPLPWPRKIRTVPQGPGARPPPRRLPLGPR